MKPSYAAVGLVGLLLGGLWYAAGGSIPPAAAAEHLRVSAPAAHDNLAVYFVHGPDAVDDAKVVTLQEALERRWAVVHETGQVNELVVENLSPDHELFVQSGDIIKGGRQDRMIASDLLLPPLSGRMPVASHCVEQSRWSGRGGEAATHFAVSDSFAVGNQIKLANDGRNQTEVWANVKAQQDKLSKNVGTVVNAAASPSSLQLALENPAVRAKAEEYRTALAAAGADRPGVVGAVFVVNGKVTSAEVYGSNGLFKKAWPKLLKAASEEALAEKTAAVTPPPPSAREVEQFLAGAGKANDELTAVAVNTNVNPNLPRGRSGATRNVMLRAGAGNDDQVGRVIVEGNTVTGDRVILNRAVLFNEPADAVLAGTVQAEPSGLTNLAEGHGLIRSVPTPAPNVNPVAAQQRGELPAQQRVNVQSLGGVRFDPIAQPVNPTANRLATNRVETGSTVLVESRDAAKRVVHRSYIKK